MARNSSSSLEEIKKKQLNKALAVGEKSGFEKNFDPKVHLEKLRNKAK